MSNDVIKEIFELKQENIMLKQENTDLNLKSYRKSTTHLTVLCSTHSFKEYIVYIK